MYVKSLKIVTNYYKDDFDERFNSQINLFFSFMAAWLVTGTPIPKMVDFEIRQFLRFQFVSIINKIA